MLFHRQSNSQLKTCLETSKEKYLNKTLNSNQLTNSKEF